MRSGLSLDIARNYSIRFASATILDLCDHEKLPSLLLDSTQSDSTQHREIAALLLVEYHRRQLHRILASEKFDLPFRLHSLKTRHRDRVSDSRTNCVHHFFSNFWAKHQDIIHCYPLIDALISSQVSTLSGFES